MILRGFLIITVFILLPLESHAFPPLYTFRHVYEQTNVSPSPSPSHGGNLASGGSTFRQFCNGASRSCQLKNITACLIYSQSGSHEDICLFVQNNGENPHNVTITILPANKTIGAIDLPSLQLKKINISSDIDLSSTVALKTSNGDCVIRTGAPPPESHYRKKSSYGTYITPIYGAYLVIILFIIGGILTVFKSRSWGRHLDGVPYHELEMGNSNAVLSPNVKENKKENWDEDWDDEWDDEKPVKSGGENDVIVKHANGSTTKLQNSNGRRKEWND